MTRVLDSKRPNLDALDPAEVDRRKRLAAETGPPRDACPGCLRDLRPFATQRKRGWCRFCLPNRDEILHRLLRVTDPHWRTPPQVLAAERAAAESGERIQVMRDAIERALRQHAKMEADLRYLRVEMGVCLHCTRGPAVESNLCRACRDAWKAEQEAWAAEQERRTHQGDEYDSHIEEDGT